MLSEVLSTIKVNHSDLIGNEDLRLDFSILRQDMYKIKRVTDTKKCISELEDTVKPFTSKLTACTTKLQSLEEKADNLKNRLGQNNLCLVGLPEKGGGL